MASKALFRVATTAVRSQSCMMAAARLPLRLSQQAHSSSVIRCAAGRTSMSSSVATAVGTRAFSVSARKQSGAEEETFEEFNARYEAEFNRINDNFELQRNLNNIFGYDLVPTVECLSAALRAARRVNDLPIAVRVFEGLMYKVESRTQYEEYLNELEPLREELGIPLKESMFEPVLRQIPNK